MVFVEELGSSAAAYSPTIIDTYLQGKQPFQPSFYEWIGARSEQIHGEVTATGNIYAVPQGYILFVTDALVFGTTAAAAGSASLQIRDAAGAGFKNLCAITVVANFQDSKVVSFRYPIVVESEQIVYGSISNITGRVCFTGFLIKKDQIPQI